MVEAFGRALDYGPGAPGRAVFYTGARGSGKTVMLNEAVAQARERGWLVVNETARQGLTDRIATVHVPRLEGELGAPAPKRRISSITAPLGAGAVAWQTSEPARVRGDLQTRLFDLADRLAEHETGLLITIDEIHKSVKEELRELFHVLQLANRESKDVAFASAGLPSAVHDLLNDDVLTFLRRAQRHLLGPVSREEASKAVQEPLMAAGVGINPQTARDAVDVTRGYPFLIQLVGYHLFETARDGSVTATTAALATREALAQLGQLVHEPALRDLSSADRMVLRAMAQDRGKPSRMADLVDRLSKPRSWVNNYRSRLIAAEVIEPAGRGLVRYTIPYLGDSLQREEPAEDW
jgi:hypothetical protein